MSANKFGEFSGAQDADNLYGADPASYIINEVRQFLGVAEIAASNGEWIKARQALVEARLLLEDLVGAES